MSRKPPPSFAWYGAGGGCACAGAAATASRTITIRTRIRSKLRIRTPERQRLCVRERAVGVHDRGDLLRRPLELLVGQHGRPLEWEVARDLQPGAAAAVVVAHADRHRPRDA